MVSLLGLPQDNNSSFLQGPALTPARIREAIWSASANMTSEKGVDLGAKDLWRDINGMTAMVAAKCAKELLARLVMDTGAE